MAQVKQKEQYHTLHSSYWAEDNVDNSDDVISRIHGVHVKMYHTPTNIETVHRLLICNCMDV